MWIVFLCAGGKLMVSPVLTTTRLWSADRDEQVRQAIHDYNQNSNISFPETPFQQAPFTVLKRGYLQNLDKDSKQLKQRWNCHICQKIKNRSILEDDVELIKKLYKESPRKWSLISRKTFEAFNREEYYSDNAIKNFCIRILAKNPSWPFSGSSEEQAEEPVRKRKKSLPKISPVGVQSYFESVEGEGLFSEIFNSSKSFDNPPVTAASVPENYVEQTQNSIQSQEPEIDLLDILVSQELLNLFG